MDGIIAVLGWRHQGVPSLAGAHLARRRQSRSDDVRGRPLRLASRRALLPCIEPASGARLRRLSPRHAIAGPRRPGHLSRLPSRTALAHRPPRPPPPRPPPPPPPPASPPPPPPPPPPRPPPPPPPPPPRAGKTPLGP